MFYLDPLGFPHCLVTFFPRNIYWWLCFSCHFLWQLTVFVDLFMIFLRWNREKRIIFKIRIWSNVCEYSSLVLLRALCSVVSRSLWSCKRNVPGGRVLIPADAFEIWFSSVKLHIFWRFFMIHERAHTVHVFFKYLRKYKNTFVPASRGPSCVWENRAPVKKYGCNHVMKTSRNCEKLSHCWCLHG